jgi:hypothetical protein
VRIPRCRATVSEDIAVGHWETGKADCRSGRKSLLASQETGVNREYQTLSRAKEKLCGSFEVSLS